MKWVFGLVLLVAVLFGLAVMGTAIFGDWSAPVSQISQPVTIDVD